MWRTPSRCNDQRDDQYRKGRLHRGRQRGEHHGRHNTSCPPSQGRKGGERDRESVDVRRPDEPDNH